MSPNSQTWVATRSGHQASRKCTGRELPHGLCRRGPRSGSKPISDFAVFGEKDYQQLCVVRQMVRDLDLPIEIVAMPTVREPDGLAMSSRNRYLSPQDRAAAPILHRLIVDVTNHLKAGTEIDRATSEASAVLENAGFKVDYVAVRDAETLAAWDPRSQRPPRVLVAAWLGKTRLIDNL
jgi:pantoate--beta-alanine ligase